MIKEVVATPVVQAKKPVNVQPEVKAPVETLTLKPQPKQDTVQFSGKK